MPNLIARRHALLTLPALAACQAPAAVTAPPSAALPRSLGATLTTTLPARLPLGTALALRYGAAQAGQASLYSFTASAQVIRLFKGRPVAPSTLTDFPSHQEPVISFTAPAGTEHFVLIITRQSFGWLAATDFADTTLFARLTLDAAAFEARLTAALATLPPGSHEVARLTLTSF